MTSEDIMIIDETSSSSSPTSTSNEFSSSQSSSVKPTITETKSNKRKVMLVIDGFNYQFKNFNKDKRKITRHSHLPNPAEAEVRNLREAMRKRAEKEILPAQQIAEQEVRQALLTDEARAVLPNIIHLGHNLVQYRRKMTPPLPQSSSFFIPESYTKDYHNNTRLLLHDSDDSKFQIDSLGDLRSEGRVLIWSSDIQLNLLFDSQRLHMDGTFSSSPPNFDQSLYRNVQSHGLSSAYLDNIMIRSVIRQMMALALVPEQYISLLFDNLGKYLNDSERDDLSPIFEHFKNYWMRQISMWNVADIPEKTDNFSEGMYKQYISCNL
ncbi:unnamed protein product [Rotaria sordida]|uniref:Uncharacterized protein n=1 Tax=Rotaria sordida TaxID=392033 RepID=A0A819V0G1_9BILA|nr:unnamed protein product [Rotaria sordida]